jgi:hypothetical protein
VHATRLASRVTFSPSRLDPLVDAFVDRAEEPSHDDLEIAREERDGFLEVEPSAPRFEGFERRVRLGLDLCAVALRLRIHAHNRSKWEATRDNARSMTAASRERADAAIAARVRRHGRAKALNSPCAATVATFMRCTICGGAAFAAARYRRTTGACPALECTTCGALCLDESIARDDEQRESVRMACAARDRISALKACG